MSRPSKFNRELAVEIAKHEIWKTGVVRVRLRRCLKPSELPDPVFIMPLETG